MKLTEAQRAEIRQAVMDMALADWGEKAVEQHAARTVWWLEQPDEIKGGAA
jgi:hypothetical protein